MKKQKPENPIKGSIMQQSLENLVVENELMYEEWGGAIQSQVVTGDMW